MSEPHIVKIAEFEVQPTEGLQLFLTATAPSGATREMLTDPVFWTHAMRKFRPLTEVRVVAQDSSWYAHLLVIYATGMDCKIHELGFWGLDPIDDASNIENDLFKVVWAGPAHQFRVVRKKDNVVVQKGFKDRNSAAIWLFRNSKGIQL